MKLIQVYKADLLNGEGLRNVYFFSGCSMHCPGCFNKEAWNPDMPSAKEWTDDDFSDMIKDTAKPYISGITLLGGDPMFESNRSGILELCKKFKEQLPDKTIWMYTGYLYEDVKSFLPEIFRYIDVLCDGQFVMSRLSPKKPWVGSDNQRVIDVKKSEESGSIVLY